jgi:hypothetical protein
MGLAAAMNHRPISGAVATLGVSQRVEFLRRTYAHLGLALLAFAAIAGGMMRFAPETSLAWSKWALTGRWNWLIVIGLFMAVGMIAEKLARSETSRAIQYVGLGIAVAAQAILLQPLLWVAIIRFGATGANDLILNAALITMAIFVGLTVTVFITKKDFSFLRGILMAASFGILGVILASIIFGFSLGAIFCGIVILVLAGYILFQTSMVMKDFPPTHHVAAALMLFSTVATLFWYVLQLLMSLRE